MCILILILIPMSLGRVSGTLMERKKEVGKHPQYSLFCLVFCNYKKVLSTSYVFEKTLQYVNYMWVYKIDYIYM